VVKQFLIALKSLHAIDEICPEQVSLIPGKGNTLVFAFTGLKQLKAVVPQVNISLYHIKRNMFVAPQLNV
jgi:hypothetical protein